jgi:hypothetical protein
LAFGAHRLAFTVWRSRGAISVCAAGKFRLGHVQIQCRTHMRLNDEQQRVNADADADRRTVNGER